MAAIVAGSDRAVPSSRITLGERLTGLRLAGLVLAGGCVALIAAGGAG